MNYADYLASPWWTARRAAVIRFRGYRCERCGLEPQFGLQLHHRTYERLGRELPEDVELLCEPCHVREHGGRAFRWGEWTLDAHGVLRKVREAVQISDRSKEGGSVSEQVPEQPQPIEADPAPAEEEAPDADEDAAAEDDEANTPPEKA